MRSILITLPAMPTSGEGVIEDTLKGEKNGF
jgi:hypothetical protein